MSNKTSFTPAERQLAGKAAAEIRRRGWMQEDMTAPPRGPDFFYSVLPPRSEWPVCLVGAIAAADDLDPLHGWGLLPYTDERPSGSDTARGLVAELTDLLFGFDDGHRLYDWNDADQRTVDEVLALLDSIAVGDEPAVAA